MYVILSGISLSMYVSTVTQARIMNLRGPKPHHVPYCMYSRYLGPHQGIHKYLAASHRTKAEAAYVLRIPSSAHVVFTAVSTAVSTAMVMLHPPHSTQSLELRVK